MSTEQNIETARRMYQAFGTGDVGAILCMVTDDVDWSTDAAIESAPWYGPRHAGNDDGDVMAVCFVRSSEDTAQVTAALAP